MDSGGCVLSSGVVAGSGADDVRGNGRQAAVGYDKRGRALPGREVNLRKNPLGVAARKPGDMLKDLPRK